MPESANVANENLNEAIVLTASDVLIGYDGRNLRTRGFRASTIETYMKTRLSVVAVEIDTDSNIITVTNGDGSIVTGTVTS